MSTVEQQAMIEQRRGRERTSQHGADRPLGFLPWLWSVHRVLHLLLLVVLVAAGAVAGAVAGSRAPVTYQSEVRLAVGPESFLTQSVAGFTEAAKGLASNYARYVVDTGAGAQQLAAQLKVPSRQVSTISSSPIAASNIIRIDVTSLDPTTANRGTTVLADRLVRQVNAAPPELPRLRGSVESTARTVARFEARLEELSRQASQARAATAAEAAKNAGASPGLAPTAEALRADRATRRISREQISTKAGFALAEADHTSAVSLYTASLQEGASTASLHVVRPATVMSDSQASTVQWRAIVGVAIGGLVGLVLLALVYARSRARAHRTR